MGDIVFIQKGYADVMTRLEIEKGIIERTRQARETTNLTQQDVAHALRCGHEQYRKYEARSPMPAAYLQAFCTIVGVELDWLISGRDRRKPMRKDAKVLSLTEFKPRRMDRAGS